MSKKYTIMFVCTGNTCRSPMAEGALRVLLEKERPGKTEIISSGTGAASGFPATIYAIEAAKMWDADISKHISRPVTREMIDKSDLILCMTPNHYKDVLKMNKGASHKMYLFKNFPDKSPDGEGVLDPIGQGLDRYNETFIELGEQLGKVLPEILKLVDKKLDAESK